MKTLTLPSGKNVNVPTTANDYELYASMVGAEDAALALTTAIEALLLEVDARATEGYAPTPKKLDMMLRTMNPLFNKYSDVGASDSEPPYVVRHTLEKAIGVLTGVKVRTY